MKNIFLISLIGLFGCSSQKSEGGLTKKSKNKIKSSLTRLLSNHDTDAFVIIESSDSQKFVQFAGGAEQELYFSFPTDQLNTAQMSRARILLENYGIDTGNVQLYTDESAAYKAGSLTEFSKKMGADIPQAVELVSEIMTQVFGYKPNVDLIITEN